MATNSLQKFIENVNKEWGPLTTERAETFRTLLRTLIENAASEEWFKELLPNATENAELYRDQQRGYVLLTHTEKAGQYRAPHDHGRGWVIYAVQQGEIDMGTYGKVQRGDKQDLVRRDQYRMSKGDCRIYLPGDIHDTRCFSESVRMFRFTSCDLKLEEKQGRLARYTQQDGIWTKGKP